MYKDCAVILLFLLKSASSIPLEDFYPFGDETTDQSTRLRRGDNSHTRRNFTTGQFNFFNGAKESVIVS